MRPEGVSTCERFPSWLTWRMFRSILRAFTARSGTASRHASRRIVIFSGSLYLLAVTGVTVLGAITPIGGVALLAGWACLVLATL